MATDKDITFPEAIAHLSGDAKIDPVWLKGYNDLSTEDLVEFKTVWAEVPADRRAAVAQAMSDLMLVDVETIFYSAFRVALDDPDARVRLAAMTGLMEDEEPKLIDPLVQLARNDPDVGVRATAAESLGRFALLAETGRLNPQRQKQIYDALLKVFRTADEDSPLYLRALESLGYVDNETVAMYIRAAFASDDEAGRRSAVIAMGRSQNRQFQEFVRQELTSVSPAIRLEAVRAAGELTDDDAIKDLAQLADDPEPTVRSAALESLAMIGGDKAHELLQQAVLSSDEDFAKVAQEAMELYEFWHGEIDFEMANIDEEAMKPRRVWQRKATSTPKAEGE